MTRYAVLAVVAALVGCSSGEHVASAEQGVAEFRQLMDGKEFSTIYAKASDELRKSANEAELTGILRVLHARLGPVKSAQRSKWNVNFHSSGTFVTLGFRTEFASGSGTEQFVFRITEGSASLVSYNVNSAALLSNRSAPTF